VQRGERAIDLACGTGDIALETAARGASVIGLDITPRMVELGRAKAKRARHEGLWPIPTFLVGDMTALPFPDASVDLVTTGYGLRNVPVLEEALDEIERVLRPGGRLLSLDFNRPRWRVVRAVYLGYLTAVGSALGWILHGDPDTYRYIPESVRRYPGAAGPARGAIFVVTHVDVPPPKKDECIAALKTLVADSRKEPGSVRYDIFQQGNRPNHFSVVEIWKNQSAYDAHIIAAHTKKFRDQLTPMSGALYDERLYRAI